jgi:hypothetical protein
VYSKNHVFEYEICILWYGYLDLSKKLKKNKLLKYNFNIYYYLKINKF